MRLIRMAVFIGLFVASSSASTQDTPNTNRAQPASQSQEQQPQQSMAAPKEQPATAPAGQSAQTEAEKSETRVAQKVTMWSAIAQAASAVLVTVFTGVLVWYSHRGWQVAKVASDAAAEQARLTRQQMVATLGAVVRCGQGLTQENATLYLTVYFQNTKQATARDLEAAVTITRVLAPHLTPISEPLVHRVNEQQLIGESSVEAKYTLDRNWLPNPTDSAGRSKRDNWDDFVQDPKTVMVSVAYSYDNGFGDRMTGPDWSQVFFAGWWFEYANRGGGSPGGSFIESKNALSTWKDVQNKKAKAARGEDPLA